MSYHREFGEMCLDRNRLTLTTPSGQVRLERRDGEKWLIVENVIGIAKFTTQAALSERDMRRIGAWLLDNLEYDEQGKEAQH